VRNSHAKFLLRFAQQLERHWVLIDGYRKATVAQHGLPLEETPPDQYIPAKYNSQTELVAEITGDESPAVLNYELVE